MSSVSEYWYEKKAIPEIEKEQIRSMVSGIRVGSFNICDTKHDLLTVDGTVFRDVFVKNRQYLYKGDYTAPSNENDYLTSTNYLSDDGLAGFSITKSGWLVSLFSNYRKGNFAKAIKEHVIHDAYKLVCIVADTDEDNKLIKLYEDIYKFRKYATTINDTNIMRKYYGDDFINAFVSNNGTPFHVFMIGSDAVGSCSEIRHFEDYFEAEAFVEDTVTLK